MATSTQTKNGTSKNGTSAAFEKVQELGEQVKEFNEQFVVSARKAGNLYVDQYEKAVDHALEYQLNLADLTRQEWLKSLIEAQTDVTREITETYTSAARTLLK